MADNGFEIEMVKDNSELIKQAINDRATAALEICGDVLEEHAIDNLERQNVHDIGALIQSITHTVSAKGKKKTVRVGSALEYSTYIEYGTGIYSTKGGRQTPWWWKGESRKWAGWHLTRGQKPRPFLKPAFTDNIDEISKTILTFLQGGK